MEVIFMSMNKLFGGIGSDSNIWIWIIVALLLLCCCCDFDICDILSDLDPCAIIFIVVFILLVTGVFDCKSCS